MKSARLLVLLVCTLSLVSRGQANPPDPDFTYRGYLTEKNDTLVSISDPKTGASQWLKIGSTYHGYKLAEINPKSGNLVVVGGGGVRVLSPMAVEGGEVSPSQARGCRPALSTEEVLRRLQSAKDGQIREISPDELKVIEDLAKTDKRFSRPKASDGMPDPVLGRYHPFGRDDLPPEQKAKLSDEEILKRNAELMAKISDFMEKRKTETATKH